MVFGGYIGMVFVAWWSPKMFPTFLCISTIHGGRGGFIEPLGFKRQMVKLQLAVGSVTTYGV